MFESIRAFGAAAVIALCAGQAGAVSLSMINAGPVALAGEAEFVVAPPDAVAVGEVSVVAAPAAPFTFIAFSVLDTATLDGFGFPTPASIPNSTRFDVFAGADALGGVLEDYAFDLSGPAMLTALFTVDVAEGAFAGFGPLALVTFASDAFPAAFGVADVTVAPAAVIPLPAAAPLLLGGFALLGFVARRRA